MAFSSSHIPKMKKCIFFMERWHNRKCGETGNNASEGLYEATHFVVVCSTSWWWSSSVRCFFSAVIIVVRFSIGEEDSLSELLHWAYTRWRRGGPICNFLRLFSSISSWLSPGNTKSQVFSLLLLRSVAFDDVYLWLLSFLLGTVDGKMNGDWWELFTLV